MPPRRRPKIGDLVVVEWVDIVSENGWTDTSEGLPAPSKMETVGWILKKSADELIVAATRCLDVDDDSVVSEIVTLPTGCVKSVRVLK